ncbi:hypothetical protein [Halobacillus litoralis]|uniref:Uncharacterized protein n=1 Tax=Halobacillus litoralis TaxID=45668 RepID=A0A410MBX8_9BACI|nr:hypothetical protein [Halobacillus litoralis]QAS52231.1 hypothetical protein HLI_08305 [Halobacillus litoralis]
MKHLKHRYEVKVYEQILFVEDSISGEKLFGFKVSKHDSVKLRNLLYFGIPASVSSSEERIAQQIAEKYNSCFLEVFAPEEQKTIHIIRSYTNLFRPAFISRKHFQSYMSEVEKFLEHPKKAVLTLELEKTSEILERELVSNPFFTIDKAGDGRDLNRTNKSLIITSPSIYKKHKENFRNCRDLLFMRTSEEHLYIGPLIYSSRFQVPQFDNAEVNPAPLLLPQEEHLLYFFIERILYFYFFQLNDKLNQDCGMPVRHKLVLNRLSLNGYSERVTSYPRSHESYITIMK